MTVNIGYQDKNLIHYIKNATKNIWQYNIDKINKFRHFFPICAGTSLFTNEEEKTIRFKFYFSIRFGKFIHIRYFNFAYLSTLFQFPDNWSFFYFTSNENNVILLLCTCYNGNRHLTIQHLKMRNHLGYIDLSVVNAATKWITWTQLIDRYRWYHYFQVEDYHYRMVMLWIYWTEANRMKMDAIKFSLSPFRK